MPINKTGRLKGMITLLPASVSPHVQYFVSCVRVASIWFYAVRIRPISTNVNYHWPPTAPLHSNRPLNQRTIGVLIDCYTYFVIITVHYLKRYHHLKFQAAINNQFLDFIYYFIYPIFHLRENNFAVLRKKSFVINAMLLSSFFF